MWPVFLCLGLEMAGCGRLRYDLVDEAADASERRDDAAAPDAAPAGVDAAVTDTRGGEGADAEIGAPVVGATTFAGTGEGSFVDGPRASATFFHPFDVLATPEGLYVADGDNHALRLITPGGQVVTRLGRAGRGFVDGDAATARLDHPVALARDAEGRILIVDERNHAIRRLERNGSIVTVAGTGRAGFKDGAGREAQFDEPRDVLVEPNGSLLVVDKRNAALRRIAVDGTVTTVCGQPGEAAVTDGACGIDARFEFPTGVARVEEGTFWIGEWGAHVFRRLAPDGRLTTIVGAPGVRGFVDGPAAAARLSHPIGPIVDAARGLLWFFDHDGGQRLRQIKGDTVSTVFGVRTTDWVQPSFQDGADPRFAYPEGFDLGADGCLYVADLGNGRIRRVCPP